MDNKGLEIESSQVIKRLMNIIYLLFFLLCVVTLALTNYILYQQKTCGNVGTLSPSAPSR